MSTMFYQLRWSKPKVIITAPDGIEVITSTTECIISNDRNSKINWIYQLDKKGLQAKLRKYSSPIKGVVTNL